MGIIVFSKQVPGECRNMRQSASNALSRSKKRGERSWKYVIAGDKESKCDTVTATAGHVLTSIAWQRVKLKRNTRSLTKNIILYKRGWGERESP